MKFVDYLSYNYQGKRVLVREDFNVPISGNEISDDTRIKAALPTLRTLLSKKAKIGVLSHLGRPTPSNIESKYSLSVVAIRLSVLLQFPVKLVTHDFSHELSSEYITLFENVRYLPGETSCSLQLAKEMAKCCDVFIMDAFATAHRKHASTHGIVKFAEKSFAGPLLTSEVKAIWETMHNSTSPVVAIVGGAKISSKLPLLMELTKKIDKLIIAGGMANTCLKALGYEIGRSLYEPGLVEDAKALLDRYPDKIVLPIDSIVTKKLDNTSPIRTVSLSDVQHDDIIGDIGQETVTSYIKLIEQAQTIIWNGPVGIFEIPKLAMGTKAIAKSIAASQAFSLAGGGDTVAAINTFDISQYISYISTGGGAFLAFLQGQTLPGISDLEQQK